MARSTSFSGRRWGKTSAIAMAGGAPDQRTLDFEDIEDLEKVIEKACALPDGALTGWEVKFIADMGERFMKFGARIRISVKQWENIRRVGDKCGIPMEV